jgi:TonB family protein
MTDIPEQDRGSSPTSVPVKDRRLHARQRVSSLTYVDLGENNGGIVLNVSEAGIRIQAAAALELGPISLRLQLPGSRTRLELNAEVIWVGPSRKEAGLYFMDLSEDARSQIRNWIARETSPETLTEEDDSESDAEVAQVEPALREPAPVESSAAVAEERADDDELAIEDEFAVEDEFPSENEIATEAEVVIEREETDEVGEEAVEFEDEFVDAPEEAPEEIADEIEAPVEAGATERKVPPMRIPDIPREHPAAALFKTPAPIVAQTPELPVSTFDGISGTHGALSMGFPTPARIAPGPSTIGGEAPLFVRAHRPSSQVPDDDGRTSYRVKLQSGWFVAVLVLLLALISFVAGMAVRRGALNSVIGQTDEPAHPQSAPPPTTDTSSAAPPAAASTDQASETAAKPLEIEIVDAGGRRWEIPAASGANHADENTAGELSPSETATPAPDEAAPSRKTAGSRSSAQDARPVAAATGEEKAGAPLMLTLPETPISASSSVAIRSRGVVPVPPGAAKSAQEGRNLQIGQLTNLVEPVYPPEAQKRGIEGTVKLHAVIGADGTIQSLEPRSGPEPLIQAAVTAVRQWKYNPTTLNGKPIETQEDLSFAFRLPK